MTQAGGAAADERALRALVGDHFDRVWGTLALLAPDRGRASAAAIAAFRDAADFRAELPSGGDAVFRWLITRGVDRLRPDLEPAAPAAERPAHPKPRVHVAAEQDSLAGISDDTLRVLVRTLEPHARAVVTLRFLAGLPAVQVARALAVPPADVTPVAEAGLAEVTARLDRHEASGRHTSTALASKPAPHLRPLRPAASDGVIVVRGSRAHVEHGPPGSLSDVARRLLERIAGWLRRRDSAGTLDDDAGGAPSSRSQPLEPTPTVRPYRKPKPTPSMREYRAPAATPATRGHRSPQGTPSTARLSNPARPPSPRAAHFDARRSTRP